MPHAHVVVLHSLLQTLLTNNGAEDIITPPYPTTISGLWGEVRDELTVRIVLHQYQLLSHKLSKIGSKMKRRIVTDDFDAGDGGADDVESQALSSPLKGSSPPSGASHRSPSSSSSPRNTYDRGGNHQGSTVTILLRKLMNLTNSNNNLPPTSPRSSATFLQTLFMDILLGTLLGVIFLLALLFLDYHHILNIGSAKSFHDAALAYAAHPDTIQSMEENFDVKIVPMVVYTSIVDEIARNTEKGTNSTTLSKVEEDLSIQVKELANSKEEYDQVKAKVHELFNLDNWCGSCKGPWGRCRDRVDYLQVKYGRPEWRSQGDLMKDGHCLNDKN